MAKRGTKRVLEYARLAMGFANVRASRYGTRSCSGGYSSTDVYPARRQQPDERQRRPAQPPLAWLFGLFFRPVRGAHARALARRHARTVRMCACAPPCACAPCACAQQVNTALLLSSPALSLSSVDSGYGAPRLFSSNRAGCSQGSTPAT